MQEDTRKIYFTLEELNYAIDTIKPNKSPSDDLLFAEMMKYLGDKAKHWQLTILNTSWKSVKLQNAFKISIIVPELKSGKTLQSARIIGLSLLQALSVK